MPPLTGQRTRRRKLLRNSAMALLLAVPAVLANADDIETRRVEGLDFDEVVVLGSIEVEISQDDDTSLQLRGPVKYLDLPPFKTSGRTLILGVSGKRGSSSRNLHKVQYKVAMPELRELLVKGSGEVWVKPFDVNPNRRGSKARITVKGSGDVNLFAVNGSSLELKVEGSGDIKVAQVEVEELEAVVAGSGELFIKSVQGDYGEFVVTGSGDLHITDGSFMREVEANVIGSGDIRASSLDSEAAAVNVLGSGSIRLGEIRETLEASIIGSGDVFYHGEPEVEAMQLGSGGLRRRD